VCAYDMCVCVRIMRKHTHLAYIHVPIASARQSAVRAHARYVYEHDMGSLAHDTHTHTHVIRTLKNAVRVFVFMCLRDDANVCMYVVCECASVRV